VYCGADDGGRRLDGGHGVARGAARDRHRAAGFEFGGGARLGAGAAQIDNSEEADLGSATDFAKAAHEQGGGAPPAMTAAAGARLPS